MAFTAKDVQSLRERTGCGMMDCKKALTEAGGDMEKAIEVLREKGLDAATKKSGRIAAEGLISIYSDAESKVSAIIEVNSETDFVAKNEKFREFVDSCVKTVAVHSPSDVETLLTLKASDSEFTVDEMLKEKILTIGENLKIRRFERREGNIVGYIHGGGTIGVLVNFETTDEFAKTDAFTACGRDVAMQIAALSASYLTPEEVPAEVVEKEKEILIAQIKNDPKNANKPDNIVEKMVVGRINKFYDQNTLLRQAFVKNGDQTVAQYIEEVAKAAGTTLKVLEFIRFEKGEGLAKREDNFADEVASMVK